MSFFDTLIGSVAPYECIGCNHQGVALCDSCAIERVTSLPSRCFRCLKRTPDFKTCANCRRITGTKHVWPVSEYTQDLSEVIKRYKYERNRGLARPLASMIDDVLPYFPRDPLVVPVPTTPARIRARGYDHTKVLARRLASVRSWPFMEVLRRVGSQHQVGANRYTRLHQLEHAFRPIRTHYLSRRDILLVDDVVTTGATLTVAARTLKAAGAGSVLATVIAHKS